MEPRMEPLQEQKRRLRQQVREKAKELDSAYTAASNEAIYRNLLSFPPWQAAHTVLLYISRGVEPDTAELMEQAWQSGKRIAVPRCLMHGEMEARIIHSFAEVAPGRYSILEPKEACEVISPSELDLVVAPCVAMDEALHRLGNGGGYYDRYLPKTHCPAVCLCRGVFVLPSIPTGPLDAAVTAMITDQGIFLKE